MQVTLSDFFFLCIFRPDKKSFLQFQKYLCTFLNAVFLALKAVLFDLVHLDVAKFPALSQDMYDCPLLASFDIRRQMIFMGEIHLQE